MQSVTIFPILRIRVFLVLQGPNPKDPFLPLMPSGITSVGIRAPVSGFLKAFLSNNSGILCVRHMEFSNLMTELYLLEKENLQVCLKRGIALDHGVWRGKSIRKTSLMHDEGTTKLEFLHVIFDPGGGFCSCHFQLNKTSRFGTNLLEEEGFDVNQRWKPL